jgi:hypothetical protein
LRVSRSPRAAGQEVVISQIRSHDSSPEPSSTKIASMSKSTPPAIARRRSASLGRLAALKYTGTTTETSRRVIA